MSAVQVPDERATRENGGEWCKTCRSWQWIVDMSHEGHYEPHGEVESRVWWFECGHSQVLDSQIIGAAPGGPAVSGAAPTLGAYMRGAW